MSMEKPLRLLLPVCRRLSAAASSRMSSRAYSRASPSAAICAPLASMLPSVARMLRWRPAADGFGAAAILHLRAAAAAAADDNGCTRRLAGFGGGAAALHPVTDNTVAVTATLHGFVPGIFAGGIGVVSDADREAALFALCLAVLFVAVIGFAEGNFAPLQLQIATGIQLCGFGTQFAARRYGGVAFQAAYLRGGYGRRYAVLLQVFLGLAVTGHRYAVFQAAG